MSIGILIPALVLGLIAWGVIAIIRRNTSKKPPGAGDGGDALVYILTAIAVGILTFSVISLGRAAFPGGTFVFDPERQVASALAGIVVSGPFAFFLWRRQRERRAIYPNAAGWIVYLSLIEAVFMTAFVISLFGVLNWLLSDASRPSLTDVFVFGAVIVFHELAARATPPGTDAGDLPRVIGSAIGLVAVVIGLGGLLHRGLEELYESMAAESTANGLEPMTALAALLAGLPIWWYHWLRPWSGPAGGPRNAWTFLMATQGLAAMLGAGSFILSQSLTYLLTDTADAGAHFDFFPVTVAVGIVGWLLWAHHRHLLGKERTDAVRAYEYSTTAIAVTAGVASITTLVSTVFASSAFVGSAGATAISAGVGLLVAIITWLRFWGRAQAAPRGMEAATAPRRFYLLGLGVIMALTSAGALIATLVFVFQAVLGVETLNDSFVPVVALFLASGGTAWHLLRTNAQDRDLFASEDVITPFDVTVVCSHPGMLAAEFPKQARVRVIYRADESGVVSNEMAAEIIAAVGTRSSLVWVDASGFRVAAAR